MAPNAGRGRTSRAFRRLAANLKAQHRPCALCHQPIDYTASWPDPDSFSVDHVKPISTHPHLAEDPGNCVPAHLRCNQTRGDRPPQPPLGTASRTW